MQGIVYGDDRFVFSAEIHKKPAVSVAAQHTTIHVEKLYDTIW